MRNRVKSKVLSFALVAALVLGMFAAAPSMTALAAPGGTFTAKFDADGTQNPAGAVEYSFTVISDPAGGANGTVSIVRSSTAPTGDITLPDGVTDNGNTYALTEIGASAFAYCWDLMSVSLPDSVNTIGDSAFAYCGSLGFINIPASVNAIGDSAFANCVNLTGIDIPDSVQVIGDSAFESCICLVDVTISDSVQSIGDNAFAFCINLASLIIPDSVQSIGDNAFTNCLNLDFITLSDSLQTVGKSAFMGCVSLTGIIIPDSVQSIGDYAFANCGDLMGITLPASVQSIGDNAFAYCTNLASITVDPFNNYFLSDNGVLFNLDKTTLMCYPAGKTDDTYVIPDSVEIIGAYAFSNCVNLTGIDIPDSVETIGAYAFSNCVNLTGIDIPDTVQEISDYTFFACENLASVSIPGTVRSIGKQAFRFCLNLERIFMYGVTAPTLGSDVFEYIAADAMLYTKSDTTGYDAAGWPGNVNNTTVLHTITFDSRGGAPAQVLQERFAGDRASAPLSPAKTGYSFGGWYTEDTFDNLYDFNDTVAGDLDLYAAWPEIPSFSLQPGNASYTLNASAAPLTVAAAVNDGGSLSYQWYSNTASSNSGGVSLGSASGAQTASYTPSTAAAGTTYYYVIVTNTLHGKATANSGAAAVTVTSPPPPSGGSSGSVQPGHGFDGGSTYTKGAGVDLVHITQKDFSRFSSVRMDGKTLTRNTEYNAVSSSTKITLYADYLDTLSVGKHTLAVAFTDGVTVTAEFTVKEAEAPTPETWVNPFEDVREDDWFYGDVEFVYTNGLMNGTSVTPMLFSPQTPVTRGMIVTILYRQQGRPDVSAERSSGTYFTDVDPSAWYADAVAWAAENGIANGYGDLIFKPESNITRQDLAVILWRYAKYAELDVSADTDISTFGDAADVAEYAEDAIRWACGAGIIGGKPGNLLDPKGTSTRAEAAAMLHRFLGAAEE